jgi:hypothetical protein
MDEIHYEVGIRGVSLGWKPRRPMRRPTPCPIPFSIRTLGPGGHPLR